MSKDPSPLEPILDALHASYQHPAQINNLQTHSLPNRRAVIEAFVHIQHLVFLGYFSTRALGPHNVRMALGEHLLSASEILCTEINRAAAWSDRDKAPNERRGPGWCRDSVQRLLWKLPELRQTLRQDVHAAFASDPAAESIEEVVFCYPGIHAITAHRVAHILFHLDVPFIPRILSEHSHSRTGIDIHPGATVGQRFFIDHGTGVVIGATSVIGDDVKIYQGVTLGAHSVRADVQRNRQSAVKRHPTLHDRVTVYSGATILGGNTVVGEGSVIGGNVWLTHSVPPNSRILYRNQETP